MACVRGKAKPIYLLSTHLSYSFVCTDYDDDNDFVALGTVMEQRRPFSTAKPDELMVEPTADLT